MTGARRARPRRAQAAATRAAATSAPAAACGSQPRRRGRPARPPTACCPPIVFIFSRVGCEAAVKQCLNASLRLTTPEERDEIRAFVEAAAAHLPDEDLHVLGYHELLDGPGARHRRAPRRACCRPSRSASRSSSAGLCRVVFATETLALGINMPARSVVIEKLSKWNGETHADITPGEYTQLTGRAGRRGIDVEGHGVVLWQRGFDPRGGRRPRLDAYLPAQVVVPPVVQHGGEPRAPVRPGHRARAARVVVRAVPGRQGGRRARPAAAQEPRRPWRGTPRRRPATSATSWSTPGCAAALTTPRPDQARARRADRRDEVVASLEALRPGDVIEVPAGKFAGLAVVIDPGMRSDRDGPRPYVLTAERQRTPARRWSTSRSRSRRSPGCGSPRRSTPATRSPAATWPPRCGPARRASRRRRRGTAVGGRAPRAGGRRRREITRLRAELRAHPCHGCAEREDHARWAERYHQLDRDTRHPAAPHRAPHEHDRPHFDRVCAC